MLSNYLVAIAALASAVTAWLVYRRDWTGKHEVLEPECYWIGYQLVSSESRLPKPARPEPWQLSILVFGKSHQEMDYGLRPRQWTIPTLRARRRIMRMYRSA